MPAQIDLESHAVVAHLDQWPLLHIKEVRRGRGDPFLENGQISQKFAIGLGIVSEFRPTRLQGDPFSEIQVASNRDPAQVEQSSVAPGSGRLASGSHEKYGSHQLGKIVGRLFSQDEKPFFELSTSGFKVFRHFRLRGKFQYLGHAAGHRGKISGKILKRAG